MKLMIELGDLFDIWQLSNKNSIKPKKEFKLFVRSIVYDELKRGDERKQ